MKNILFVTVTMIFISGCFQKHPDIVIYNKSKVFIDSVQVYADPRLITSFKNIELNGLYKGKILFDSSMTSDGGYVIHVFQALDTTMTYPFGYYTNGASMNREFEIIIYDDSIDINEK